MIFARVVNPDGDCGQHRIKMQLEDLPIFLSQTGDVLISLEKENGHKYCEIYDQEIVYINLHAKISKEVYQGWVKGELNHE